MHVQSLALQPAWVKRVSTQVEAQLGTLDWAMTRLVKRLATMIIFILNNFVVETIHK